ncbi:ABC transporter substrate-binding protein [Nocardioides sp. KR10-350]|uniref:ABC transporter substrate-binding protein n=1 Tax=Nocardioides cheoyonin TaxID=3156615 RepID=UPI0032B3B054
MTRTTRRGHRFRRPAGAAALLLVGALALAGCGRDASSREPAAAGDTTGVTDTSIKVGATFPLTGVAAPGYSTIPKGAQAYFDYVNDNGGVYGRKIDYIVKDDAYNPTTTSSVTNELVLKDQVFAMLGALGTPTHEAVVDFLNSSKVPDIAVSSGSVTWGDDPKEHPWTFGWQTDYESEGKIIGKWIADNMPKARVGLFLQNDDFGASGEKGLRDYIDKQIVAVSKYTPGGTDVTPQIAALQAKKADLVVGFNVPSYTALSQLVAMKLNYKPQWFYTNVGSDPTLVGSLLANFSKGQVKNGAQLLDGVMSTAYLPDVSNTSNPWIQTFDKIWKSNGSGGALTNYELYGMSQAYMFVQALQATGKDLTREALVKTLEEKGGDFTGPVFAPYRYSADSHLGTSGMKVVKIEGGQVKDVTGVETTDIGDADITESSESESTPPADGIPPAE